MASDVPPPTEFLDSAPSPSPKKGRRGDVIAGVAVLAVGVIGAGAWGVAQFLGSGSAPATAVPGDALAYLALDLDPAAGQKLEAYNTLKKFPILEDKLGLGKGDDIRRWLFEGITADLDCDLKFEDVDAWLGSKVAVAVVPSEDEPTPFGVFEIKDQDKATAGVEQLDGCADSGDSGIAFVDDFMIVAETEAIAKAAASDAEESTLADDDTFKSWMEKAGDPGIIAGYVAPEAASTLIESVPDAEVAGTDADSLTKLADSFKGAAMVVRFDDGALEAEATGSWDIGSDFLGTGTSGIGDLPETTAVAVGLPTGPDWVSTLFDNLRDQVGAEDFDAAVSEAEAQSGLTLPDDLEALVGDGFSLALDSSLTPDGFFGLMGGGGDFPLGLRIVGDPDSIGPALDKVLATLGPVASGVSVEQGAGAVAVSLDSDQAAALAEDGDLGGQDVFTSALTGDDGAGALFIDFDIDGWMDRLIDEGLAGTTEPGEADDVRENLAPLSALGIESTYEDGEAHFVFRLTTD